MSILSCLRCQVISDTIENRLTGVIAEMTTEPRLLHGNMYSVVPAMLSVLVTNQSFPRHFKIHSADPGGNVGHPLQVEEVD